MIQRQNAGIYIPNVVFTYFGEHLTRTTSEAEQHVESLKHGNSGGRPPRNSRGTLVLLCSLTGIVIGGITGAVIGMNIADTGGVPGSIAGVIIGGLLGSFVGEYLKRRKYRKLDRLAEKLNSDNTQGPLFG